jgi:hypothetical protein
MDRFDSLTQELATAQTRRSVLKRLAVAGAVSLGAGAAMLRAPRAGAASGVKAACARKGQACGSAVTDPTRYPTTCCPGLTCNAGVCQDA